VPKRGVRLDRSFLPYPAQRNLQRLPASKLLFALSSLAWRRVRRRDERGDAADLQSYLMGQFGEYLTRTLMEPLNSKMWAHGTHRLSKGWVTLRSGSQQRNVPDVSLRQTLRNLLLMKDAPGWTENTFVTYPAKGGSGAIWRLIASRVPAERMLLGRKLAAVDLQKRVVTLDDGEQISYGCVLSSIPLDIVLRSIEGDAATHARCEALASRFVYARSRLFGFGIRGPLPARFDGLHSFHVPAPEIPFWRLTFPSNMSSGNAPEGECFSVLVECSEPAARAAEPEAALRERVLAGLRSLGVLESGHTLCSEFSERIEHGYPVPFLGRDGLLAEVRDVLEPGGVYGRGRFGAWKYEISNQDHAFMQGVEWVRRMVLGIPEETYTDPFAVNETESKQPYLDEKEHVQELAKEYSGWPAGAPPSGAAEPVSTEWRSRAR
jgi:protoporphyrinogen oxidase